MIFARSGRTTGRHARDDRARRRPAKRDTRSLAEEVGVTLPEGRPGGEVPAQAAVPAPPGPGPYDITEAPAGVARLDLGSLQIPSVPGVEVRVQAGPDGVIQQVYLVHGESVLQVGVFAAPRSEPLWDEVRDEIRQQLFTDGVAAQDAPGPYGTELRARVRTPQGLRDLRFVGIDGPRWMIRAVFQGPAAVDPAAAGPLDECLRGLVVDRGPEARPVKEALPLRLSPRLAEHVRAGARASVGGTNGVAPGPVTIPIPADAVRPRRRPSPRPRPE